MKVIKDLDIATIEAMHDELFSLGKIKIGDNMHKNYRDLIKRMYESELYEENKNINHRVYFYLCSRAISH